MMWYKHFIALKKLVDITMFYRRAQKLSHTINIYFNEVFRNLEAPFK
jgi:hypothetical protein